MVEGFVDTAERTTTQLADDLVAIGDVVVELDFGVTLGVGEVGQRVDTALADIMDLVMDNLLFLELC
jgi:hypothetical protein